MKVRDLRIALAAYPGDHDLVIFLPGDSSVGIPDGWSEVDKISEEWDVSEDGAPISTHVVLIHGSV